MFDKNKNILKQYATVFASQLGLVVMSLAATVSLIELHEARMPRVGAAMQPAFAAAAPEHGAAQHRMEELIRREKEENRHALVSYGTTMRSHPTAGRI